MNINYTIFHQQKQLRDNERVETSNVIFFRIPMMIYKTYTIITRSGYV